MHLRKCIVSAVGTNQPHPAVSCFEGGRIRKCRVGLVGFLTRILSMRTRFGDGYMITVRTKSSLNVKEVVRFFNRNFPEAVLKVRGIRGRGEEGPTAWGSTCRSDNGTGFFRLLQGRTQEAGKEMRTKL